MAVWFVGLHAGRPFVGTLITDEVCKLDHDSPVGCDGLGRVYHLSLALKTEINTRVSN